MHTACCRTIQTTGKARSVLSQRLWPACFWLAEAVGEIWVCALRCAFSSTAHYNSTFRTVQATGLKPAAWGGQRGRASAAGGGFAKIEFAIGTNTASTKRVVGSKRTFGCELKICQRFWSNEWDRHDTDQMWPSIPIQSIQFKSNQLNYYSIGFESL